MKHKVLAIVVSLTLILSMVLPGTLAVSTAQDSATSVMTAADTAAKTEESITATPTTATPTTGSQTEKQCNCTPVNGVHAAACPLYEVPKAGEKTADTTPGTAASTTDGTGAPTEKTCNCGATGDTHAATCPLYVAPKTEETAGAPTTQPPAETQKQCTCGTTDGTHTAECDLYVKPEEPKSEENAPTEEKKCNCTPVDGVHAETCPLYVEPQETQPQCTCGTTDGTHAEGCPLYVEPEGKDFASMTDAELYSYLKQLNSDAEVEAFLKQLPEDRLKSLMAYAAEQEPFVLPKTVVFTKAGPFMPPVNASRLVRRAAFRAFAQTATDNGLELSKSAKANNDGTYTIRMEAYTTGTFTSSTKTIPVDIVLVLDQSGSMAYDFNGNSTNTNTARRQYAMKEAVNNFIDKVAEKYSDEADHRMSIVTFGSDASTRQGWTYVNPSGNPSGKNTLQGKINGLPNSPSGATNVAAGMKQAETLMGSGYSYTGNNTTRQKVVIVFTDGVPTTDKDFDTTVATNAIASAKNLKDGGATVYTVGIFNGANPNELYGASGFDINSDGTVGSSWVKDAWGLFPGTDFPEADRPAGNRFLNLLSSNYSSAESIGLNRSTGGLGILHYKITYAITANYARTSSSYYLTANDSESLNSIFQTISNNIQTANIDLGSQTVVKDTVSKYFDLPANASDIHLYTAAAKADGTFEDAVAASNEVKATIDGTAVSVTGFDFNANFVSKNDKGGGDYGKKLIIEFEVTPKDEFIGGNDVPTNDWENTAVYDKNGAEVEKFADATTTPTVNVPIKVPEFTVNDKTIYEGNSVTISGLYTLPVTTGWEYDYVKVTTGAEGVEADTVSPADCRDYNVKVTYAPKTDGSNSVGTANDMAGKSTELTAKVHVLKPTVTATINDVQKFYGESYTLGDGANGLVSAVWADASTDHTSIPPVEGTAPYVTDNLSLTYSATDFNGTVPKHDFDVTVKVMNGDNEITGAVITTTCDVTDSSCETSEKDGKYTVHVKTCQLTITKQGGASGEPYVFTVKKDNAKYSEVTIVGNGSVTIYELPVGTYTIVEDTGWSWRYPSPTYSGNSATLDKDQTSNTITCSNTKAKNYWLNGYSGVVTNTYESKN